MRKRRIDELLVDRGFAVDKDHAARLARAGRVRVNGQIADKPGKCFPMDVEVSASRSPRFVSRGGNKLEAAFIAFGLKVEEKVCIDVGASTGGFTDCLLQHAAARVYAVDCGRGQLAWRLRCDERVVVMENRNARYIERAEFEPIPEFAVVDASFISLNKLLPAVCRVLADSGGIVALVKPQFEAARAQVEPGGVVRDPGVHSEVLAKVRKFGEKNLDLIWRGCIESGIKGPAGNIEFLAYWMKR